MHPPGNSLSRVFTGLLLGSALLAGGCIPQQTGLRIKQECEVMMAHLARDAVANRKLTITPECEVILDKISSE